MKHSKLILGSALVALTLTTAGTSFADKGGKGRALGKDHKSHSGLALGKGHDKDDSIALGRHHSKQSGLGLGKTTHSTRHHLNDRDRDDQDDRDRSDWNDRDSTRTRHTTRTRRTTRSTSKTNPGLHLGWTKGQRNGQTAPHSSNSSHGRALGHNNH